MKRKSRLSKASSIVLSFFISGAALFGTTACDANVQTALVTGLNQATITAAGALINAAFLSITPTPDQEAAEL